MFVRVYRPVELKYLIIVCTKRDICKKNFTPVLWPRNSPYSILSGRGEGGGGGAYNPLLMYLIPTPL